MTPINRIRWALSPDESASEPPAPPKPRRGRRSAAERRAAATAVARGEDPDVVALRHGIRLVTLGRWVDALAAEVMNTLMNGALPCCVVHDFEVAPKFVVACFESFLGEALIVHEREDETKPQPPEAA